VLHSQRKRQGLVLGWKTQKGGNQLRPPAGGDEGEKNRVKDGHGNINKEKSPLKP